MIDDDTPQKNPPAKTAPWGTEDSDIKQEVANMYIPKEIVVDLKKQNSK
ncbi:hypothetical protein [Methanoregula sp.]